MSKAEARQLSPGDLVNKINQVADIILGFGEDVPQIMSELRAMRDSAARIAAIVAKHVTGRSAPGGDSELVVLEYTASDPVAVQAFNDPTVQEKERELLQATRRTDPSTVVAASDAGRSAAPVGAEMERGSIRDILMFFVQNPQLLQLILNLFKQTNPS